MFRRRSIPFGTRTLLSIVLLVAAAVSPGAAIAAGTFADDDGNTHEADIEFIAQLGITSGCNPPTNDLYCPDRAVTRGEMAAFLARALGLQGDLPVAFLDAASSTFRNEIALIAQRGITKGCNPPLNTLYCPTRAVTRGEMAAFLARAFHLHAADEDYFYDDDASTFEGDINALAQAGITVGCGSFNYCPTEPVQRDQMASFIRRALTGGLAPPEVPDRPGSEQPPGSIPVEPGESLAEAVANNPSGTTFYLTAGVHRLATVRPKDGNVFVGAPGAILSGARVLTGFQRSGELWMIGGQTQHNEEKGTCLDGYDGCVHPEQLFIDDSELWQVTSLAEVEPGKWFFDYSNNTIYIADDPTGKLVETSVTPVAFDGDASSVVIRDLVIERYATPAQMGVIHGQRDRNGPYGHDWLIEGNEIRFNASEAIALGQSMTVKNNYLHHNGRTGVYSGLADGATIVDNEISHNCRGTGYLCFGWGGGGIKLAGASNTMITSNDVHHNFGAGIHVDVQAVKTTFDANTVTENDGSGIFVEVSHGATIANNYVAANGFRRPEGRGAGINISASVDVVVVDNSVIDNALGIVAYHLDREPGLDRLTVSNNLVVQSEGHIGLDDTTSTFGVFDVLDIEWNRNTYEFNGGNTTFVYGEDQLSPSQWVSKGFDTESVFR